MLLCRDVLEPTALSEGEWELKAFQFYTILHVVLDIFFSQSESLRFGNEDLSFFILFFFNFRLMLCNDINLESSVSLQHNFVTCVLCQKKIVNMYPFLLSVVKTYT